MIYLPFRCTEAMDSLAGMLSEDGAFNLESVLNPVKDQISSAIMQSHENAETILHKVSRTLNS